MKNIEITSSVHVKEGIGSSSLEQIFADWLRAFEATLTSGDPDKLAKLFVERSYWRDQIGLTWDMRQYHGREALIDPLIAAARNMAPANFRIAKGRTPPRMVEYLDTHLLEGFCNFDLPHGVGQAMVRLDPDVGTRGRALCYTLGTDLLSVHGVEERHSRKVTPDAMEPVFPIHGFEPEHPGQTWPEYLASKSRFNDRDPDVLVVGGGHSGVMIGARLQAMGVSYLIVDKGERPGDSWRKRYESLALHTVGATNQLPYIPTPDVFPDYIPKDRWADWIESYSRAMGLSYWSSTELVSAKFDDETGRWACDLRLADGSEKTVRPVHVALALAGVGSKPIIPELPGLHEFGGQTIHSSQFKTGRDFAGQRVLVVGTSTSGHDIALDLYNKGAKVTMAQRGPTIVTRLVEGVKHNANYVTGEMSVEEADQRRGANMIRPLRDKYLQLVTARNRPANAKMNAALEKAGLRLWEGPDDTGWLGKLARDFAGFYINMGCADVIAAGGIRILQLADLENFQSEGWRDRSGAIHEFDTIIFATGFNNPREELGRIFGPEVADRIGPCSGFDAEGEQHGNCRPLRQRQIWQIYGGINDCRRLSKIMALQIAAQLAGKVPPLERQEDNTLRECPTPKDAR